MIDINESMIEINHLMIEINDNSNPARVYWTRT